MLPTSIFNIESIGVGVEAKFAEQLFKYMHWESLFLGGFEVSKPLNARKSEFNDPKIG